MGIDAGFDMVPRLSRSAKDQAAWTAFISKVRERYASDPDVEFKENYIVWKKGEHPMLPYAGHKFLRFSAKISGSHHGGIGEDIFTVSGIARSIFGGRRARCWYEGVINNYFYGWAEVLESWDSYDQPDEPEDPPEESKPLFAIQTIPNKGRGLVATADIPIGTRIIAEKPLFTLSGPSVELLEGPISNILKTLPEEKQKEYRSLHNNYKSTQIPPLAGIFKTNALPCGHGSHVGGIYLTICLINHSCLPNTHHSWNDNLSRETIHVTRPIKSGEEITISYTPEGLSKPRQRKLKESFGFDCKCPLCTSPPRKIKFSDRRRTEIEALDASIAGDGTIVSNPLSCLKDCRRLIKLLKEEYGGSALTLEGRAYFDAFQVCIGQGDQARARVMAERGYKLRALCEGEDSEATQEIRELIENPAEHRLFGFSMGWRSEVGDVPVGLEEEAFEKWLWRS
ncbi:uncharacterized protein DFL_002751 [Arthrobotrys flagrans]|uniref:SET domain-containing protein n=1 Tax=Arthrobotrys flagrans TaxID=97331 RepID=A0A437ABP4_ARTFL|nr:hypothetical protein DFL_002751 [Arthrobotrys flagrans]